MTTELLNQPDATTLFSEHRQAGSAEAMETIPPPPQTGSLQRGSEPAIDTGGGDGLVRDEGAGEKIPRLFMVKSGEGLLEQVVAGNFPKRSVA